MTHDPCAPYMPMPTDTAYGSPPPGAARAAAGPAAGGCRAAEPHPAARRRRASDRSRESNAPETDLCYRGANFR